jgi:transposase-like protein
VLEAVVTARRDKAAALKLLKRIMKKYGAPRSIVTDGLLIPEEAAPLFRDNAAPP